MNWQIILGVEYEWLDRIYVLKVVGVKHIIIDVIFFYLQIAIEN